MTKEQLKEKASKELTIKFPSIASDNYGNNVAGGKGWSYSLLDFINSLIDKAFEEGKKEGSKGAKFDSEQKGKEDMNYELIEEKYFD